MINFANGSEPIINPWLLYLADVLDGLKILSWTVVAIACVYVIVCLAGVAANCDLDDDDFKKWYCNLKKAILPTVVSMVFAIVMPSKDTLYKMAIAEALTPDNVKMAYDVTGKTANDILNGGSEFIKDIMDYGVEKIDEMRNVEPIETEDNAE